MDEPDYPPLTDAQKTIMHHLRDSGPTNRSNLANIAGLDQRDADNEVNSLIIRGAVRANVVDRDLFALGAEADAWMP
ncbi:hypothetical protein [Rosistilla oblonga]|uniref:hypothetical protein n=1 Tax=Rosistilla oblonga TaxID=2527990 RepID=UPI003A97B480